MRNTETFLTVKANTSQLEFVGGKMYEFEENMNRSIVHNSQILLNGQNILPYDNDVYIHMYAQNSKYFAIGICIDPSYDYNHKDSILIMDKKTGAYKIAHVYYVIGRTAGLQSVTMTEDEPDNVYFTTDRSYSGYIDCKGVFETRRPIPYEIYTAYDAIQKNNLSSLFTYQVTDGLGILMTLRTKYDIDRRNYLLCFDGFGNDYDAFKIWSTKTNAFEPNALMFINTQNHTRF